METIIKWKGSAYSSFETCTLIINGNFIEARADITGIYRNNKYSVHYCIKSGKNWLPYFCEVSGSIQSNTFLIAVEKTKDGSWLRNFVEQENLRDCTDIDISITPFTNTFPVNRLKHLEENTMKIDVVYIDIMEQTVKPSIQQYTRISDHQYKFENIPNDFEATITVDDDGLVTQYPRLFNRI